MKKLFSLPLVLTMILIWGCVLRTEHKITAHITVDIRHIEQQAEKVLDYIEGETETLPGVTGTAEVKDVSWFRRAVEFLSPIRSAYAAELKESSPLMTQIVQALKNRHPEIAALKKDGCLGETNRGYVELRPSPALENAEKKNEAQRLAAAENADRKALYNEVARLNKDQGVTVAQVEKIYASKRLERAEPGEIFQLPPAGAWFDEFKSSAKGQRLGDTCKPGAWVTVE